MARIDWVDRRLQQWAEACTVGDGSGYPQMSTIHRNWMPPAQGITPTLKVAAPIQGVAETARAVGQLSAKLQVAVIVHYCKRGRIEQQCGELGCSVRTLHERVERAHAFLAGVLTRGSFCKSH